jgi:uncharacterized membrane protein
MMNGGGFYGGLGAGELLVLLFGVAILIVGVVLIVAWFTRSGGHDHGVGTTPTEADRALTVARERLARGEITKEEYEEIMRVLAP